MQLTRSAFGPLLINSESRLWSLFRPTPKSVISITHQLLDETSRQDENHQISNILNEKFNERGTQCTLLSSGSILVHCDPSSQLINFLPSTFWVTGRSIRLPGTPFGSYHKFSLLILKISTNLQLVAWDNNLALGGVHSRIFDIMGLCPLLTC